MTADGRPCASMTCATPSPSHLIVDLGLDVAQVSRILGPASITITLDVYTHLFDDARHRREIRRRMAESEFASLLYLRREDPVATVTALSSAKSS